MTSTTEFTDALTIVDRLAERAGEDLELVTRAIHLFSSRQGRDVVVDIESAETWIIRQRDAREFE